MKYKIGGFSESEIIKKYYFDDEFIIVEYLDGHKEYYDKNDKNCEIKIKEKMLMQARELVLSRKLLDSTLFAMIEGTLSLGNFSILSSNSIDLYNGRELDGLMILCLILCSVGGIGTGIISLNYLKEVKDILKYKKLIKNQNDLEKFKGDKDIYKGIKKFDSIGNLDINTIDNYSNKEANKVYKNIKKLRNS